MNEIIQGTDAWRLVRVGKVTASRVCDVTARTKSGWSATRDAYMAQLLVERLTGVPTEGYKSPAMQYGNDTEPQARAAYEFHHNCDVAQIGFVDHPRIFMAGCSPDGLVGDDGLIEAKCPLTHTHIETLLMQKVPAKYVSQMQFQMSCTGRAWCDYISFDPRVPAHMQLFIKRIERDDKAIAEMETMVSDFLGELDAKIAMLDKLYGERAPA